MRYIRATGEYLKTLLRKAGAYKAVFNSQEGRIVLIDLAKECGAARTTFNEDPHEQARLEGRRQIWLHLRRMLKMTEDDVEKLLMEGRNYE